MTRIKDPKSMRVFALLIIACAALGGSIMFETPYAQSSEIPVPQRKPNQDAGIFDFTKALIEFKKPEVTSDIPRPEMKPGVTVDNRLKPKAIKVSQKSLSENDAKIYQEIFTLQDEGKMRQAEQKAKELKDTRLLGHVLYQRYMHPTAYNSSFQELKSWLNHYSDHPGAHKIYALAQRKKPTDFKGRLKTPENKIHIARNNEPTMAQTRVYISSRQRSSEQAAQLNTLNREIRHLISEDRPTRALSILEETEATNLLDAIEFDTLRARIAASYLYNGKIDKAYKNAAASAKRSGLHVPLAGWVAGLSAWMKEDYTASSRHFEIVGRSSYASAWTKSAGAYWAARAHMRRGDVKAVSTWLNRSQSYPRTFYGLVATRALGRDFDFNWKIPTFTKDNYQRLITTPEGFRAMALMKAGQNAKAEAELIRLDVKDNEELRSALLAYAGYARLPGLAMRLGTSLSGPEDGAYYDAALYPMGPWQLDSDNAIDPALVHAIMRQESRFDPNAESRSGAKGLMQLMPRTAKSIDREKAGTLDDPEINLELGQQYLTKLLDERHVNQDLIRLLIAYNAGPGNLQKWSRRFPDIEDPLLFIELIPVAETRAYVERVLANYWIYRLRDNAPTPTLDAVVAGKPARYEASLQTALAQ